MCSRDVGRPSGLSSLGASVAQSLPPQRLAFLCRGGGGGSEDHSYISRPQGRALNQNHSIQLETLELRVLSTKTGD